MTKTTVALRHLAFEDLGSFDSVLRQAGYQIRYLDVGLDPLATSDASDPDLLIVLGGPIGAYDESLYPFLATEIGLIERRLAAGKATLGICLGAQLMARALGERVYPGPRKEIGFKPIGLTREGEASCLRELGTGPVLHWHGDTFDLPRGATRLALTDVCENQAFSYGPNALAFQFHPEAEGRGFERWLIGHALELGISGQDIVELRAQNMLLAPDLAMRGRACMASWLAGLERQSGTM